MYREKKLKGTVETRKKEVARLGRLPDPKSKEEPLMAEIKEYGRLAIAKVQFFLFPDPS